MEKMLGISRVLEGVKLSVESSGVESQLHPVIMGK